LSAGLCPRLDALPEAQRRLWPELAGARRLGLVLYDGTAIALRLGHRISVDFDFFTETPLDRAALIRALPILESGQVLQDAPDTMTFLVRSAARSDEAIKLSFFGPIRTGRVGRPEDTDDGVLVIASPEDLLGTKLKVLMQRVEAKDYRDVLALIASGMSVAQGLGAARALFGQAFQPSECLKALSYFEGGDLATLDRTERERLIKLAREVERIPEIPILSRVLATA